MAVAEHPTSPRSPEPACLFGRVPSKPGFIQRGLATAPEHLLQAWFARAAHASGALPAHGVRFAVAPHGIAMLGVWIASRDARGAPHPLVFVRRAPAYLRALPWPLRLAGCASFLDAAEFALMLARQRELELAWSSLESLAWPAPNDLEALQIEARQGLVECSVAAFARRNFHAAPRPEAALERTLRGLAPRRERDPRLSVELPAHSELDLVAWLALLGAQRTPGAAPHAVFWARADARAIVCFDAPHPRVLQQLAVQHATPEASESSAHASGVGLCSRGSIAELSRALAVGGASLPAEAFASMPPPLAPRACGELLHCGDGVLETYQSRADQR